MTKPRNHYINVQTVFWAAFFVVFFALAWALNEVLAPFVTGLAIAYLLNPSVTSLSRYVPRGIAAMFVLIGFAVILSGVIIILSPLIGRQTAEFISNIPNYLREVQAWAKPYIDKAMNRLDLNTTSIEQVTSNSVDTLLAGTKSVIPSLLLGGKALVGIGTFLVITPVVAFYCMRDWPILVNKVDQLFPRDHKQTIRSIFREFDARLSGFVRGQLLVCLFLGVFYSLSLTVIGLNYALAIGAIAGLLSFIPYVGSTFGFVSSVTIAFIQFGDFKMPLIVIALFILGQLIEGNVLTPKLVGERVGLHPVWVIFALMAAGALFGFTGLIVAVPVAALIGVLIRHAIVWYQHSEAYLGDAKPNA